MDERKRQLVTLLTDQTKAKEGCEALGEEDAVWLIGHRNELSDQELGEVIGQEAVPIFRRLCDLARL